MEQYQRWPAYIAKVGHQFYPAESITEQLMTRVGEVYGLRMAQSKLMICAGQLRFMSRYFLMQDQMLNHGADILSGWLEDETFVTGVAGEKAEKGVFTFQVYCAAIRSIFPRDHEQLLRDFVRMIGFDALVGNQDRHFYNWGVITNTTGSIKPKFAPIYDTARGLFWNTTERDIVKFKDEQALMAYVRRSRPQIGWDDWQESNGELGHFDLVSYVATLEAEFMRWLQQVGRHAAEKQRACEGMIDAEFDKLLSNGRRELIKRCLRLRLTTYNEIFAGKAIHAS